MRRGIYCVHTGEPSREATLWAAVQRAGTGAVLSHQTAAELFKISDQQSSLIHLTVPVNRHVSKMSGVVLHRSSRVERTRHPSLLPPRTKVEETVLDLVHQARTFDTAFNAACASCQRRLTTADRLVDAMGTRKKLRWRAELTSALSEIGTGTHSILEYRYVRLVEQPHGLPRATRQAKIIRSGKTWFLDNLYEEPGLCVELDGKEAHPDDHRWHDIRRANAILEAGLTILRYGWSDVDRRPCQTAAQIGAVLANLGWPGTLRACGHSCQLRTHDLRTRDLRTRDLRTRDLS
ncbi:MAG TPA: hypothetical protein VNF47_06025 [Streptosporangiaceae bacterium]|nr:hypothetical protein [Streptosporangiaceae bacterium]